MTDWYAKDIGKDAERYGLTLPQEVLDLLRVDRASPDVQRFSLDPQNEYFVPKYLTALKKALD